MKTRCSMLIVTFFLTITIFAQSNVNNEWSIDRFKSNPTDYFLIADAMAGKENQNIITLYEEHKIRFNLNSTRTIENYYVYQILNSQAINDWDYVKKSWAPWQQNSPKIQARVLRRNGSIFLLDQKTILDSTNEDTRGKVYSDRRTLTAPLPGVEAGAIIEILTIVEDSKPMFIQGASGGYSFGDYNPVRATKLILDLPQNMPIQHGQAMLPDVQFSKKTIDNRDVYTYLMGFQKPWPTIDYFLPSEIQRVPMVYYSTFNSWQVLAESYAKTIDTVIEQSDVSKLAKTITGNATSPEAKISAIINWMSKEIRYTGIEFGESAYIPYTPKEVISRQYGDCKDKATLMVALLRNLGFSAELALVDTGPGQDLPSNYPGINWFDHAIVHVSSPKEFWIDPTEDLARLGQIPYQDAGRFALIAKNGTNNLVRIPKPNSNSNYVKQFRELRMADMGKGSISENLETGGYLEIIYRSFYEQKTEKQIKEWLESYLEDTYQTSKADVFTISDPKDLNTNFQRKIEVKATDTLLTDLEICQVRIGYAELLENLPNQLIKLSSDEEQNKSNLNRVHDFELNNTMYYEYKYKIYPPRGFENVTLPKNLKIAIGPTVISANYKVDSDNSVLVTLILDTGSGRYSAVEYRNLQNSIIELLKKEVTPIRFEPRFKRLLKQDKPSEAFTDLRVLINSDPKNPSFQMRYAKALFDMGLCAEARKIAEKTMESNPNFIEGWNIYAFILRHDLVGRDYAPGADFSKSLHAYQKAYDLDSSNYFSLANFAILSEYNSDGMRYGPGSDLPTAIKAYKQIDSETRRRLGIDANLSFALLYSEKYQEARKEAESLNNPALVIIMCVEAIQNSPESALDFIEHQVTKPEDRSQLLRISSNILFNLRFYSQGAALLEAGAYGEGAQQTRAYAQLFKSLKKSEALFQGPSSPQQSVYLTIAGMINKNKIEYLSKSLSPELLALAIESNQENHTNPMESANNSIRRLVNGIELFTPTITDLLISILELRVDGNDNIGYRLRFKFQGSIVETFYVAKINDSYRVIGTGSELSAVASWYFNNLNRLPEKELRTTLDWFREEYSNANGNNDDVLSGNPFNRYWTKNHPIDSLILKNALVLLMADNSNYANSTYTTLIPILSESNKSMEEAQLLRGLWTAAYSLQNYDLMEKIARILFKQFPDSDIAFINLYVSLLGTNKTEEIKSLSNKRLEENKDDLVANEALLRVTSKQKNYSELKRLYQAKINAGNNNANDLNGLAWASLFSLPITQDDLDVGIKAAQAQRNSPNVLHTLACLFVEKGMLNDGYQVMLMAMNLEGLSEPTSSYRYVLGRISAQCGLPELATSYYKSIQKPKSNFGLEDSVWVLAQYYLTGKY